MIDYSRSLNQFAGRTRRTPETTPLREAAAERHTSAVLAQDKEELQRQLRDALDRLADKDAAIPDSSTRERDRNWARLVRGLTSKARHKRALAAQPHILGQRHNAAVEAIISIHDDNVAAKVAEADAAAASKLKKHRMSFSIPPQLC